MVRSGKTLLVLLLALALTACTSSTHGPNQAPVAVAGPDRQAIPGQPVRLDAVGSYDPDGDFLVEYRWSLLAVPPGSTALLENRDQSEASITPDTGGVWLIGLVVNDGEKDSEPDVTRIRVGDHACLVHEDCPVCQGCDLERNCVPQAMGQDLKNECADLLYCDGVETCDGAGQCQETGPDPCPELTCDEDLDQCTGCDQDEQCPACQKCGQGGLCENQSDTEDLKNDCDEADPCLTGFCNGAGQCNPEAPGTVCDDGLYCNGADSCDGAGNCSQHGSSPCPETDCNHCQESLASCFDPSGTSCGGAGIECMSAGTCDGAGNCSSTPDHDYCTTNSLGTLCIPECAPTSTGCVTPPDSLYLVCDHPVVLPEVSGCVLSLNGGSTLAQEACLSCSARLIPMTLDHSTFGDGAAECRLEGWEIVPGESMGDNCRDAVAGCAEGGGAQDCCDDLSLLCAPGVIRPDGFSLSHDKVTDCGSKHEEFRIEKKFDFTALSDIRVCFDAGCQNCNQNDGILVIADDGSNREVVGCFTGYNGATNSSLVYRMCTDGLPGWVEGNNDATIVFVVHSEADNHTVALDNVTITAFSDACSPTTTQVLDEDFNTPSQCDTTGWAITGGAMDCTTNQCDNLPGWAPGIEADQSSFVAETHVDTSVLDGRVNACFVVGWDGTDVPDSLTMQFDAGSGWQTAWRLDGNMGTNGHCQEFCVNLSDFDPAVNRNPSLGLRFDFQSVNGKIWLYHVSVSGQEYCTANSSVVTITAPVGDGLGNYDFTVADAYNDPLAADIRCVWEPQSGPEASQGVTFGAPFTGWTYRRKIVFQNGGQPEALTDFPVPVRLSSAWFQYGNTEPLGADIRFVDSDFLTVLPYEIETWNPGGDSVVWVKVPHIPGDSTDDYIWMFYGRQGAEDAQDTAAVWDRYFLGVWHLGEESGDSTAHDSSRYGTNGSYNGPTLGQAGGFGDRAASFDGDNDRITLGTMNVPPSSGNNGITIEAHATRTGSVAERLVSKADGIMNENHWWMLSLNDGLQLRFRLKLNGATQLLFGDSTSLPYDQWMYAAATYDGARMRLFLDGDPDGGQDRTGTVTQDGGKQAWIGANPTDAYNCWSGNIGEIRISNIARTEGWIQAQHRCMSGTFTVFEAQIPP